MEEGLKEAEFYSDILGKEKKVQCKLCPHFCVIENNGLGKCRVRLNVDGKLYSLVYEKPCSLSLDDPIEKKPLYHFLPSARCLSIATLGCNLFCLNCQNWSISQEPKENKEFVEEIKLGEKISVKQVVEIAKKNQIKVIAYTYTEPTIFYEYAKAIAKEAKKNNIKNVLVSNGFINPEPLAELIENGLIDAANIDLKGISEEFYREICGAKLAPILKTLKTLKEGGIHLEITNLLIPGKNTSDGDIEKLVLWIKNNLGDEIPLHFSAFYPMYKLQDTPATPPRVVARARKIALENGLKYVYAGNIKDKEGESTFCPNCRDALVVRTGFQIFSNKIKKGACYKCGEKISGVWE